VSKLNKNIEGVFVRTSLEAMVKATNRYGAELTVCRWMNFMLESRSVVATLTGETLEMASTRGYPQEGVLSPLMWSLVMDELLGELNGNGYYTTGCADDIAILINRKFPSTVLKVLQTALELIQHWCDKTDLSINPRW
jgi:hypothetical protein